MCPPGVDQTERSPQRYVLLAPRLKQSLFICGGSWGSTTERERKCYRSPDHYCEAGESFDAFRKLYKPAGRPPPEGSQPPPLVLPEPSKRTSAPSPIERLLPVELLRMLMDELPVADLVAFGLSSQSMWAHASAVLSRRLAAVRGPWAGTPLICTGTYLTDLPEVVFEMFPRVRRWFDEWSGREPQRGRGKNPVREWNWAIQHLSTDFADLPDLEAEFDGALNAFVGGNGEAAGCGGVPAELRGWLRRSVVPAIDLAQGKTWYLRNLTAKTYVRMELCVAGKEPGRPTLALPGREWATLDVLLLQRIVWTRLGLWIGPVTPREVAASRGVWAGHSFDVVDNGEFLVRDDTARHGDNVRHHHDDKNVLDDVEDSTGEDDDSDDACDCDEKGDDNDDDTAAVFGWEDVSEVVTREVDEWAVEKSRDALDGGESEEEDSL